MSVNNDKQEIYLALSKFVDSWSQKENLFDACVDDEPFIYLNMFDNMYSKEDLVYALGKANDCDLQIRIYNHAAVQKGDEARQYATIIGLFSKKNVPYMHLAFGGTFANKLVKKNGSWKLKVIRFNLQFEDSTGESYLTKEGLTWRAPGYGNRSFIKNWKTLDDRIGHNMTALPNMGLRMISPDYDTPWYAIKENDLFLNDEEQIKETLYKYTCAFDLATFHLISDVLCDNVYLKVKDVEFTNRRDAIGYLKMLRKSTPRAHNSVEVREVEINGNTAHLTADKIAPELRNLRRVSDDFDQWIDGSYKLEAVKENDQWHISKLVYERKED